METPTKLVITTPWEALYVNLIGAYTLNGKVRSQNDFIRLAMIHPFTCWLEIAELSGAENNATSSVNTNIMMLTVMNHRV